MRKSINTAVFTFLTVVSFSSNASLISVDWKTTGDNLITRDTQTGLEWLDLTETVARPYSDISSQLGLGDEFDGWAYASMEQVKGLLDSAGGSGIYTGWSSANNGVVSPLIELWGDLDPTYHSYFLMGHSVEAGQHTRGLLGDRPHYELSTNEDYININVRSIPDSNGWSTDMGSALVRNVSAVPIPAAAWLFGSGLIGLVAFARRKKQSSK